MPIDPTSAVVAALYEGLSKGIGGLAKAFVAVLWAAYKRPLVLGSAILGFSVVGLAMIIASRAVTGWWQLALLGFGTSLLIVGTVELGILGVLKKIIEPDDRTPRMINAVTQNFNESFTALRDWLDEPGAGLRLEFRRAEIGALEVATILRELAGRLDGGAAEDNGESRG